MNKAVAPPTGVLAIQTPGNGLSSDGPTNRAGTAAKLVNGHYQKSDYNASFVGFIPSRNPALTILVVIDSPHGNGYTGGAVSAVTVPTAS